MSNKDWYYQWAVVCIEAYYAGQGISCEIGEIRQHTYTKEEADKVCEFMNKGWGEGCWIVKPYEEAAAEAPPYDTDKLKRVFANRELCAAHNYVETDEPQGRVGFSEKHKCTNCGDWLDRNCAGWYMAGRKDQTELPLESFT